MNRPCHLPLFVQINYDEKNNSSTRSVAESFDEYSYKTMINDINRNICYHTWINTVNKKNKQWLEIGPGPYVCLGKMVLKNNPETYYWAVEVNKDALKKAKKIIKEYSNATIKFGYIDENYKDLPKDVDIILHEIFGVIASAEGVGKVLYHLMKKFPNAISIPQFAITYIVPLALKIDDVIKDSTLTINKKLIKCRIPFDSQLTEKQAILESFDFGNVSLEQSHNNKLKIKTNGELNVLGIYIWLSFGDIVTSSNCSIVGSSTNWANVGLILPYSLSVKKTQEIIIKSSVQLDSLRPTYYISVSYKKSTFEWNLTYDDLYGNYKYLHMINSKDILYI